MFMTIQKYMNLVYYNHEKMIFNLPTGWGANMGMLDIVSNEMKNCKYHTLIISPNNIINENLMEDFSYIKKNDIAGFKKTNVYSEEDSTVYFKTLYSITDDLWSGVNNVFLYNVRFSTYNNKTIKLIEKIINVKGKVCFINCYIEEKIFNIVTNLLGGDVYCNNLSIYVTDSKLNDEADRINMDIRNKKLKRIKENIS